MIYAKMVSTNDPRFGGRVSLIMSQNPTYGNVEEARIPIPNNVVLCNGCNRNLCEVEAPPGYGYLIYLGKRELKADQPYDIYCEGCMREYFPKAQIITEEAQGEVQSR